MKQVLYTPKSGRTLNVGSFVISSTGILLAKSEPILEKLVGKTLEKKEVTSEEEVIKSPVDEAITQTSKETAKAQVNKAENDLREAKKKLIK